MIIKIYLLIGMIFCHIIDDFVLQGWLANGKQKEWWRQNAPSSLYKNDYVMALLIHGFEWACVISIIPVIYLFTHVPIYILGLYLFWFVSLWLLHSGCDHLKANTHEINLIQDQLFHLFQITLTWIWTMFFFKG